MISVKSVSDLDKPDAIASGFALSVSVLALNGVSLKSSSEMLTEIPPCSLSAVGSASSFTMNKVGSYLLFDAGHLLTGQTNGLITGTPQWMKSSTFRVTTVRV
jgi:hypothetical protein